MRKKIAISIMTGFLCLVIATVSAGSDEDNSRLFLAVEKGDLEGAKALLTRNPDLINAHFDDGRTVLMKACERGTRRMVEFLLSRGVNIDAIDNHGDTALMIAAKNENTAIAASLISRGADVQAQDSEGRTALMMAAAQGCKSNAELLIAGGCEVNGRDRRGKTALMYAVTSDLKDTALFLISRGADVNAMDREGRTALIEAIDFIPRNMKESTNYYEMVRLLVNNGANVNAADNSGRSPMRVATEGRHKKRQPHESNGAYLNRVENCEKIEKLLLEKGAKRVSTIPPGIRVLLWILVPLLIAGSFYLYTHRTKFLVHKPPEPEEEDEDSLEDLVDERFRRDKRDEDLLDDSVFERFKRDKRDEEDEL
jgi:ankyrin repeat protein